MLEKIKKRLFVILLTVAIIATQCAVSLFPVTVSAASYSTNDGYFHDQGGDYMSPVAPTSSQAVTLKFRTPSAANVTAAKIQYSINSGSSWTDVSMSKSSSILDGAFNIWQGTIPATSSRYYYRFKLTLNYVSTRYYALGGLSSSASPISNCYQVWPDFSTPDWSHGAYWYYVAPTSFFNGDSLNDIGGDIADYASGKQMNGHHYLATYGGDVKGVSDKLSYIKDLGCTGVYLNPLHLSYNANGYGIMNNYMLDSQYATENTYKQFVKDAHSTDMRVMFDVLAHSVIDANVWFNSYNKYPVVGAYNSTSSIFRDMFHFENGAPTKFLASNALDYANDVTKNLMYKNEDSYLSRYLSNEYGADALRFDAGAHLYGTGLTLNQITADLTGTLKSRYPDKLLVCENYTDDSNSTSHLRNGWDTCWNTPMIYWMRGLAEGTQTMSGFVNHSLLDVLTWPRDMVLSMQQLITSHDLERLQNSADETGRRMARIFQMTYVGSPMLYYGDETDAESLYDSKIEQFDWNQENWNMNTYNLVKGLGQLRNEYTCLKNGVVKFGQSDNNAKTLSMARWDNNGAVISLLNGKSSAVNMTVNVAQFEVANGTVLTDYFTGKTYTVSNGTITANVLAGGTVLVTGGNTVSTIGKYNKALLGGSGTVTLGSDSSTLTLSGTGTVTGAADSGLFVYSEADGGFELSADVTTTGTVALALRDTTTAQAKGYYAVVNGSNKTISVYKRESVGQAATLVTTANYTASTPKIKLVRSGNNDFSVQLFENSVWNTVANSQVKLSLASKLYAGAINLSGTATISGMGVNIYNNIYYDGFISDKIVSQSATHTVHNISLDKTVYGEAKLSSEIYTERTGASNGGYDALIVHLGNVTHTSSSWSDAVTGNWYLYLSREYGLEMRVKKSDGSEWYWGAHYKTLNYPDSNSLEFKGPYTLKYALSKDNLKVWLNGQLMYDYDYSSWASALSSTKITTKLNYFATGHGMTESITPVTKVTDYKVWTEETNENTLSANFTASGNYTVSGGKFKFTESGLNKYLSKAPRTDWTAKTVVGAVSGYAGVVAYANDNDFILAGRSGKNIVLARVINGDVVIYDAVKDERTTADLQVQLQKIGNYYSLSYRYADEYEWKTLSNRIFTSYTTIKYGFASNNSVEFDYITLGNMIDTGASICTPISKAGEVEFNYSKLNSATNMVKWNAPSGNWENVAGGLSQTSTGESYYVTKSKFTDFRAEVTLGLDGMGYAGVIFASENAKITKGYSLTLKPGGALYLNIDNNTYDIKYVSFDADGKLRVIIERIGDRIIVYTNKNPKIAFNIVDTKYSEGYFGFVTSGAPGYFGNYTVFSLADSWTEETDTYIGNGRVSYAENSVRLNANGEKTVALHQKGIGYTDVFASVELSYTTAENSYAGLSFASAECTNPFEKGIVAALKNNSSVVILKDGIELTSAQVSADNSNQMSVAVQNGTFKVYFNDLMTPVLTYYIGIMGGNVGIAAKNIDASFRKLVIDDISGENAFDSLGFYKASVNSVSKSEALGAGVTIHTPTNSLGYTNNGYSYNVVNNSGMINTEYFALNNSSFDANGCYEVSGILKSGASTSNTNIGVANALTVAFRKVTYNGKEGYLKVALTENSGGLPIIFDTDYYEANNRAYFKYPLAYDDGTYTRNDNADTSFKIVSDDKTVSVWINGTLVLDSFDYSVKVTNIAPAAGLGFNCCRCNITDFAISKASSTSSIIKNVGKNGSIKLSNDSPAAGEKVIITKNGTIASGTLNAYYLNGDKAEKIVIERIGYRENEASVDKYSFIMPNTTNPVVITCDFADGNAVNISALGAQYRENGSKADIRFGTRLGYQVENGVMTVNGKDYTLVETGTLITTVTALNTVEGTHEELVTLGSEALWGEQHKYIKNVKRTKYYDYCNEYIDFAVSVTGITDFDKVYVARGYALTKDIDGNNVVFYTDIMYRTVNQLK